MTATKTAELKTDDLMETPVDGSRGLATRMEEGTSVAVADQAEFNATSMLAMVERLALDDRVDAGKLETVMRVANGQQDREQEKQFYQDKNRAVRAMPVIRKEGKIVIANKAEPNNRALDRVQGRFETWTDVQRAIIPVLNAHNLTLTHKISFTESKQIVIAVLTHDNGFREESGEMGLPLDISGGKNNVQGAGSSQTYGLRYTTRAICGLRFEDGQDDDGMLTPMLDEPLNDQQARRVAEATAAWNHGDEAFEHWWSNVQTKDRVWFVKSGRYSEITGREPLPGTKPKLATPEGDREDKEPAKKPETTADEWTDQYEADQMAAATLEELADIQRRGKKSMDRLKEKGLTALHDRAIKAGSDAYALLTEQDGAEEG